MRRHVFHILLLLLISAHASLEGQADLQQLAGMAQQALSAEDYERAGDLFEEIVQRAPNVAEVHSNLGLTYFMRERYAEAVDALEEALRLNPRLESAQGLLGLSYCQLSRYRDCLKALEAVDSVKSNDPLLLRSLTVAQIRTGEYEGALNTASRLLKLDDEPDEDALYYKGQAAMMLAMETFERLQRLSPDSHRIRKLKAETLRRQGHVEPAIGEYRRAIEENPGIADLHYGLGEILYENKRLEEAVVELEKALALSPVDPVTNLLLGNIYLEFKKFDKSEEHLRTAIAGDESLPEAHLSLAKVLRTTDRVDEAIAELRKTTELLPESEIPHYMLYEIFRKSGEIDRAKREMEIFQELREKRLKEEETLRAEGWEPNRQ